MKRPGFTLVEILVATTLALLILGAVITVFGNMTQSIAESRSMLETAEQLRLTATRLQQDLGGITVTMNPPRKPENNEGYFEYIEGPATTASAIAKNTDGTAVVNDTTAGDFDDILMFTTRSTGRPFVGKCGAGNTTQSDVAEVAWFLRGRTLHRRVLLVRPSVDLSVVAAPYYANCDISARIQGGNVVPNTLGDLTRRECRFAHDSANPLQAWGWYWTVNGFSNQHPTLPTLMECSSTGWTVNKTPVNLGTALTNLDFWTNNSSYRESESVLGTGGTRVADDVILNNVIGFDVKAWDPDARAYVDLGNGGGAYRFSGLGGPNSALAAPNTNYARVYDTYSTSHFYANGANGLDDDTNGVVDDNGEKTGTDRAPPYPCPLRGVQVKIRVFEPDSKQVREVTVVQDFLPQ